MLAVGEHVLPDMNDRMIKIATGLGGGIGSTHEHVCGAFSAGVLLIGARYGRTDSEMADELCQKKVRNFREAFHTRLGSVICRELREESYGSGGEEPCAVLVERAAGMLLDVVDPVVR